MINNTSTSLKPGTPRATPLITAMVSRLALIVVAAFVVAVFASHALGSKKQVNTSQSTVTASVSVAYALRGQAGYLP
jgi:hypothetical protein